MFQSRAITAAALLLISALSWAQTPAKIPAQPPVLTEAQARAAIATFYEAFNAAPGKDAGALVLRGTADNWLSCAGNDDCKPRDVAAKMIPGLSKLMPDLRFDIEDLIVKGNQVVVRGEVSGTPVAEFMGVPHGGKRFKVMSIDIHTVENGKLVGKSYHVEDWMAAAHQLRGQ